MKTTFITSLFVFGAIVSYAQEVQKRETKPFHKIEISGATSLIFTQSDTLQLRVEADKDEINNLMTDVSDGILSVKAKGNFKQPYKIYVSGNHIQRITVAGASKITGTNALETDSLTLDVSGASSANLSLKTTDVDVMIGGASSVNFDGTSKTLHANISGASTLKAYKLNTTSADVKASGASTAKIFAAEKVNANATGSSTIKFKGDPKDVSAEASTSSQIAKVIENANSNKKSSDNDSTKIDLGKKQLVIINKDRDSDNEISVKVNDDFHHWGGFAMGVNGWLSNGNFGMPKGQEFMSLNYGKSLNFQLNPFEKNIHLYKNYINLVTGIGFEWNQYEFGNRTRLNPDTSFTCGSIDSSNVFRYKKNRLKTTFVNVPLLLEFNTNKRADKSFHVAFGVIGGYKLGSRTRQILQSNGDEIRVIRKDNYNINPFRLNAHASIGYKKFTVFADYALTPLFESGKGPELYPFTIGVKLVSF